MNSKISRFYAQVCPTMDMKHHPWILLLSLFFFSSSLNPRFSLGADTISANASLSGDQTIVSSGGNFALGFFKPGNASNYYVAMRYNKISTSTLVWVANRNRPIPDKYAAELKIRDGNLVLLDGSQKTMVWSTELGTTTGSSEVPELEAVLLDSGNFVLRHKSNASGATPIWESFDNPTHTWLPGSKLGLNKRTGRNQRLTSWKNSEDPASGPFFLELDPNGSSQYFIMRNGSGRYWTSGPWNGRIFSLVPEMSLNYIYNFSYVNNSNESYFIYSVYDTSILSRFIMDISGQARQETWLKNTQQWNLFWAQPRQQCEVSEFCGGNGICQNDLPVCQCLFGFESRNESDWSLGDYSSGCVRKTRLNCATNSNTSTATGEKDKFFEGLNMKLPDNPWSVNVESIAECKSACLNNCSCTAYAYESGGCSIWTENLTNMQQVSEGDSTGKTLYVRLAASEFPRKSGNKAVLGIALGLSAGVLAVLGLLVLFFVKRRRKSSLSSAKAVGGSLTAFGYKDLQVATKNFSDKLGGGGFGSVFKGTLPDLTVIAVKKLESVNQGEKQFRTEVSTIGTIQHVNLVRLRGFCSDGAEKLLVYDYMPNGSLDAHLFQASDSAPLDWKKRYQIAVGIARGLAYLHEKCRDCIIHCDIKPENILLDAEFCPKVADFGLAKLVGRDFSRILTTMRGTRGYLAPEWISGVAITAKADVYSYGMMLLEIVSGNRNSEASNDGKPEFFPNLAANIVSQGGDVLSLLDPLLGKNAANLEEIKRVCTVACWCIQDDETRRPSMGEVVQILEGVLGVNVPPVPRSLQMFVDSQEHVVFFTESSSCQSSQTMHSSSATSSQAKMSSTSSEGSKT